MLPKNAQKRKKQKIFPVIVARIKDWHTHTHVTGPDLTPNDQQKRLKGTPKLDTRGQSESQKTISDARKRTLNKFFAFEKQHFKTM